MRILVTGGAGFIGSHLCEALVYRGHQVTALDDLSAGNRKNLHELEKNENFKYIQGCVTDKKLVRHLVSECEAVMHFAAAVGVRQILQDPIKSLRTNIEGSENVMTVSAELGRELVLASTSEIYGKSPAVPITEETDRVLGSPLKGRWSYSEAKAVDETIAKALFDKSGFKVKIVRLFNMVGPRQTSAYGMVIPRFIEAALRAEPLMVYGNGSQKRVFCHIDDAIEGIISLWGCSRGFGEAFNLGGFEEISILELAEKIKARIGSNSEVTLIPYNQLPDGFEDFMRRVPSTVKLQNFTGWKATKSLDDILRDTLEHIKREAN